MGDCGTHPKPSILLSRIMWGPHNHLRDSTTPILILLIYFCIYIDSYALFKLVIIKLRNHQHIQSFFTLEAIPLVGFSTYTCSIIYNERPYRAVAQYHRLKDIQAFNSNVYTKTSGVPAS